MKIKSSYQPGAGLGHVRRFSFSSGLVSIGVSIVGFVVGLKGQEWDRGRVVGWQKAGGGGGRKE